MVWVLALLFESLHCLRTEEVGRQDFRVGFCPGFLLSHPHLELGLLLSLLCSHFSGVLFEPVLVLKLHVPFPILVGSLFDVLIESVQVVLLGPGQQVLQPLEPGMFLILNLEGHTPVKPKAFRTAIEIRDLTDIPGSIL